MNYIRHLNAVLDKWAEDDQHITTYHISLYIMLFKLWNRNRFKQPIQIYRRDTMQMAKIGSINTYSRCMRELHEWGYIQYLPSYNPQRPSKVTFISFDTGADTGDSTTPKTIYKTNKTALKESNGETNPPTFAAIEEFFRNEKYQQTEAQKFFNHYQANGWLQAGKTPILDWQAAAHSWMLKVKDYSPGTRIKTDTAPTTAPQRLATNQDKDYGEPL